MKKKKADRSLPEELRRQAEERMKFENALPEEIPPVEAQKLIYELQVHQIELEMQNDELRRTQETLEESRSRYLDLYDFSPIGYLTLDKLGFIKEGNLTAARLLQVERGQLIDRLFAHFMVLGDREALRRHLKLVFEGEERQTIELRLKRNDGNEFLALVESAFYQAITEISLCRTVFTDITARKFAEEAFKKLVVNAPIGIFIVQNGKIKLINPALQTITGYREDELLDRDSAGFVAPEFRDLVRDDIIRKLNGFNSSALEFQIITRSGEKKWVVESVVPIQHEREKAILVNLMDISAPKALALLHAQKLEAVGTLAGGIAHDFNNILTAILGNIGLAMLDSKIEPQTKDSLAQAEQACLRAQSLSRQLLTFAKGGTPIKKIYLLLMY